MMEPLVTVREIKKILAGKFHLGPLNLEIEPGYIVAVVGPNGSGKSTFFRMLMGMIQPDEGEIGLFGQVYPKNEVAIKQRIGYVPETSELQDYMKTVADVIRFSSHWFPSWDNKRCEELLIKFELEPRQKLNGMSKGTRRKLDLVQALSHHPDLLLLDELSSGLDPFAWRIVQQEIADLMKGGQKSVLMATHIMDEVRRMADYIVFLYHGKLLGCYEKDTLLDSWKALWVDRMPERQEDIPGLVALEHQQGFKVITESPQAAADALKRMGINVLNTLSLDLDEIFLHLLDRSKIHSSEMGGNEDASFAG
jgi:ABC-2 type transport system ATP-binding protein